MADKWGQSDETPRARHSEGESGGTPCGLPADCDCSVPIAGKRAAYRPVADERDDLDAHIASRLAQVSLPAEVAVRLQLTVASLGSQGPVTSQPAKALRHASTRHRENWSWIGVGLAVVSLCLLLAVWWGFPRKWDRVEAQQLAQWAERDWLPRSEWLPYRYEADAKQYPVSQFVRVLPRRWQILATDLDPATHVYELPATHATPARLYSLWAGRRVHGLPRRPPQQPQTGRDGRLVAAWQEADFVYVLTVSGPLRNYWGIVRPPAASLARTPADSPSG